MTTERAKKSAEQEAIGFLIENQAHIQDLQSRLQAAEQRLQTMQDALRRLLFACNNQNQITTFGGLLERTMAEAEKALAAKAK